jgi:hypothetical protein
MADNLRSPVTITVKATKDPKAGTTLAKLATVKDIKAGTSLTKIPAPTSVK